MRNYILFSILSEIQIFGVSGDDETVIPEIQLLNYDVEFGNDLQRMSRKYRKVKRLEEYPEEKYRNSEADIIQGIVSKIWSRSLIPSNSIWKLCKSSL